MAIIGAANLAAVYTDKAREMGVRTHCFAWEKGAVAKGSADFFYPISITDMDKILKLCKEIGVAGVIPTTELTIPVAAYISQELGLTGIDYDIAVNLTNKFWVREHLKGCKVVRQPQFRLISAGEYKEAVDSWNVFPAITKPTSEGGKRGVSVVNSRDELMKAMEFASCFDKNGRGVLIEEYLAEGREYSVETISFNGTHQVIQITQKISSGPPHCVELGHQQPAALSSIIREKVIKAVNEILTSVSYSNGPSHTEIKIVDNEIYLIELNSRIGGDLIASTLTHLSTGYDFIAEAIKVYMGERPQKLTATYGKYSGVYFITKQTAFLKPIFDSCQGEKWVYERHFVSDDLTELSNNDSRNTNYIVYWSDYPIDLINRDGNESIQFQGGSI